MKSVTVVSLTRALKKYGPLTLYVYRRGNNGAVDRIRKLSVTGLCNYRFVGSYDRAFSPCCFCDRRPGTSQESRLEAMLDYCRGCLQIRRIVARGGKTIFNNLPKGQN